MRQLHLGSNHFLHPQEASVCRIGSLSSDTWSPSAVSWNIQTHTGHTCCMAPHQPSTDVSKSGVMEKEKKNLQLYKESTWLIRHL